MNIAGLDMLLARDPTAGEPAGQVRAMPVVLHIEKATPPGRTALLEAAAAAAVAVCLDDRAAPGGPWHEQVSAWLGRRIRKVTRRARGVHWRAVGELPGVTATVDGAEARALVPGLVSEVPPQVRRLQISGTDLDADSPGPPAAGIPVLWLNPTVPMTLGKAAAQVGHGSMLLAATWHAAGKHAALTRWAAGGFRCAVRTPIPAQWRRARQGEAAGIVVPVRDAGFTEVAPGTVTVLAMGCP